jgi:preprotein translocase YajC subunit
MTSLDLMMQLVVFSTIALGLVYFLFYRPTVDAQRKARRVVSDLQVGDEVVTHSGFFGRVVEITEPDDGPAVVGLDLGGVTVRARVTAVAELLPRPEAAPDAAPAPVLATAGGSLPAEPGGRPDAARRSKGGVAAPPVGQQGGRS